LEIAGKGRRGIVRQWPSLQHQASSGPSAPTARPAQRSAAFGPHGATRRQASSHWTKPCHVQYWLGKADRPFGWLKGHNYEAQVQLLEIVCSQSSYSSVQESRLFIQPPCSAPHQRCFSVLDPCSDYFKKKKHAASISRGASSAPSPASTSSKGSPSRPATRQQHLWPSSRDPGSGPASANRLRCSHLLIKLMLKNLSE